MCHKFNKTSQTRLTLSSRKETKKPLFFKPKLKPEPENKMTNFPSLHATAKSIKILDLHVWFIVYHYEQNLEIENFQKIRQLI